MTGKQRKSEVRVDDEWVDVTEHVADPAEDPVSLDGLSAEAALLMLRALRKAGDTVVITATLTEPKDTVVVDGHAFGGQRTGAGWAFDARSLDMACRVAGWSKVERDRERWRLS